MFSGNELLFDLDDVVEALECIDPNIPYDEWSRLGRALYVQFGDDAESIFHDWSATGDSYKGKRDFRYHWRSFSRTRRISFGSFVAIAKKAGWKPKRRQYTDEEKREYAKRLAKLRHDAKVRRETEEEKQWRQLEKERKLFESWPSLPSPTKYMLQKQMVDLPLYLDVRLGRDKYGNQCLVWPIYSDLFNQGKFCGFERVLDKKVTVGARQLNKFSSDAARTDIGFATFGTCDHGHNPSKVYVVGGLADAYSMHISTKEVTITPIGEGNIPQIINRLRERYPETQFIAAPDCDKTGREIVNRATENGGYWSLPVTENFDWSDTYIQQGAEQVKQQANNIRGFEFLKISQRYLDTEIKAGLNLLKSPMGSGKTSIVRRFIKSHSKLRCLVISHRVQLVNDIKNNLSAEGINVVSYLDAPDGSAGNAMMMDADVLIISVDSLYKVAGSNWDLVFVDEIEQNLSHYKSKTIAHPEDCLNYLHFVLKNSTYQILADAHLGSLTLDFCNQINLSKGRLIDNEYVPANGKKMHIYESKDHLTEEVVSQLVKGKRVYFFANSKEEVKSLAKALEIEKDRNHFAGKTLVVHADVTEEPEVKDALKNINAVAPELDAIFASPTLGTGFSIDEHNFDFVAAVLNSQVGTAEEGHQGINRARNVKDFHIYVESKHRDEPTDPEFIRQKLIDEVSADTMRVQGIDPNTGELAAKNPLYEWLFCRVSAEENLSKNGYALRFLSIAREQGYEIIDVQKDELSAQLGENMRAEAKDRTDRENLRSVIEAPIHRGQEYDAMMARSEGYSSYEIAKSKTVRDFNLDSANDSEIDALYPIAVRVFSEFEQPGANAQNGNVVSIAEAPVPMPKNPLEAIVSAITYLQMKNRFGARIRDLALTSLNPLAAKRLDQKDIDNSNSRVRWHHYAIRQKHKRKLLKIAGLDEDLDYNGKQWCKEILDERLRVWLSNPAVKDELYKLSGFKVTESALEKPTQWFNQFLKRMGIPVNKMKKSRTLVPGKLVNAYSVNVDELEANKTLIALRNRGIEQHLFDELPEFKHVRNNVKALWREVYAAQKGRSAWKAGWMDRLQAIVRDCRLLGMDLDVAILDRLKSRIASHAAPELADPPQQMIYTKHTRQGGSLHGSPLCDNEGGEEPAASFQDHAPQTNDNAVIDELVTVAQRLRGLPEHWVRRMMADYGQIGRESLYSWVETLYEVFKEDELAGSL